MPDVGKVGLVKQEVEPSLKLVDDTPLMEASEQSLYLGSSVFWALRFEKSVSFIIVW
jgi:hypothetical protein